MEFVNEIHRVGLIVPSSNTTMETEIPRMLRRRADADAFTFHSSRVRLDSVTAEELARMVADSDRCAVELADAQVDVMAYACLVAVMSQGEGAHRGVEQRLTQVAADAGCPVPVPSSAGALVRGLQAMGAGRVAILTPYMKPLTARVVAYLEAEGIAVADAISLEISKNVEVARHDPLRLVGLAGQLDVTGVDAVVLSACVQLPSLPAVEAAQQALGLPVLTAGIATTYEILTGLGLDPVVPDAGHLLSGAVQRAEATR